MRCTYYHAENEDGMLPVEVELLLSYTFNKAVPETRGRYDGDTPGEPAHISDIELVAVTEVRLNDHGLMLHDKRWLVKLFADRLDNNDAFLELVTRHCEEDYTKRTEPYEP